MRGIARVYWRLLGAGFRRQSTYRLAAVGGVVANATFGLLKVAVLVATVHAAGGELAGYDVGRMSTYIWLSQAMLGSLNLNGRTDIAERIKDGRVAVDFLRPLDVRAAEIVTEVGRSMFALIPRGIPMLVIGVFVGMVPPGSLAAYPLGAGSLLLGIVISVGTAYLVGVAGFWLVETRGLQVFYMVISGFLAGLFVPIGLFPRWLLVIAEATPFPSMMMYPIDVLAGRVDLAGALGLLAVQVGWLVGVAGLGQVLTRAGRRRLEVQGGCGADSRPSADPATALSDGARLPGAVPDVLPVELRARPGELAAGGVGRAGRGLGALPRGDPARRSGVPPDPARVRPGRPGLLGRRPGRRSL
nr:ABC-2 family transporter protein [Pseudofrankia sp. DC12]